MDGDHSRPAKLFEGWDTYQASLVDAIKPLSRQQLVWKPLPELRRAGQMAGALLENGFGQPGPMDCGRSLGDLPPALSGSHIPRLPPVDHLAQQCLKQHIPVFNPLHPSF